MALAAGAPESIAETSLKVTQGFPTDTRARGPIRQTPIPGTDIGVGYGQADFVIRVNRAHTAWLDTQTPSLFAAVVQVPSPQDQPAGTHVRLAYRGATLITSPSQAANAALLDPYGDHRDSAFGVIFVNNDPGWVDDIRRIDGARYVQVRITLICDSASGTTPELAALGLAYPK